MAKANKTSFKKGQVANPNGRPKGAMSEYRKKFMEMGRLAANDAKDVYEEIRACMKAGESWAYQLYVKDLIPKKSFEPTVLVKMEEGETRVEAITNALPQFVELTHNEALEEIKVLKSIELEERKNEGEDCSHYTDDELRESYAIHEKANARKLSQKTPV
jgi:hypothetical protein